MRRRLAALPLAAPTLIAVLFAAAACGPATVDPPRVDLCVGDEDPPADGKEAVILGTTQGETFVPLKANDAVTLIHGPQGGQHIHMSTRLYALTAGKWEHDFKFISQESGLMAGSSRELMKACAPGWTESHNIRVYIDDASINEGTVQLEMFPSEQTEVFGESSVKAEMPVRLVD